eukprot:1139334-Pelagomonas_calceolata.AAC.22
MASSCKDNACAVTIAHDEGTAIAGNVRLLALKLTRVAQWVFLYTNSKLQLPVGCKQSWLVAAAVPPSIPLLNQVAEDMVATLQHYQARHVDDAQCNRSLNGH